MLQSTTAMAMDGWNPQTGWDEQDQGATPPAKRLQQPETQDAPWQEDLLAAEAAHWNGTPEEALKHFLMALLQSPDSSKICVDVLDINEHLLTASTTKHIQDALNSNKKIFISIDEDEDEQPLYPASEALENFLIAFYKAPTAPWEYYLQEGSGPTSSAKVDYYRACSKKYPNAAIEEKFPYIKSTWQEDLLAAEAAHWGGKPEEALKYFLWTLIKYPDSSKISVGFPDQDGKLLVPTKDLLAEHMQDVLNPPKDTSIYIEDEREAFFPLALERFLFAFQDDPDAPWAHCKERVFNPLAPLEYFQAALKRLPNAIELYRRAASVACFGIRRNFELALHYSLMAVEKNPEPSWEDYKSVGKYALCLVGKDELAFHYFLMALKANPEPSWEDYEQVGEQARVLGKNEEALRYLQQALEKSVGEELDEEQKANREFLNLKISLLQHPEAKEKIFQDWIDFFTHNSEPEETLARANAITEYYDELGLFELDPLVQAAIRAGILAETSDDPLNPYNFHKKLLEERKQEVDWSQIKPIRETINGYEVHLNPEFFEKNMVKFVMFKGLPPYNPFLLKHMIEALDGRVKDNPKLNPYIQEVTGLSYEQLKATSITQGKLQERLAFKGQPEEYVSLTQIRLIELINFIGSLSNKVEKEDVLLSEQEEALIRSLAEIQGCPTGVEEGIQAAYLYRVPTPKKTLTSDQEDHHIGIVSVLHKQVEKMFSGNNLFAKDLIGMKVKEEVQQASHQATYLRNRIGNKVGLPGIKFDNGTLALYKEMVEKTLLETLQAFYKYLLPSTIVDAVGVHAEFEDKEDTIDLLEKMGVLKILSKPQ
jgi:tetratricopeptide (TPR) repeat protein